jgi:hypothetical protein
MPYFFTSAVYLLSFLSGASGTLRELRCIASATGILPSAFAMLLYPNFSTSLSYGRLYFYLFPFIFYLHSPYPPNFSVNLQIPLFLRKRFMIRSRHNKAPLFRLILWIVLLVIVLWVYAHFEKVSDFFLLFSGKN